ncbi:glycine--tRNA ligase subunit beta [Alphaproteobacteria bacterium]|nr:glycine--tRNA ligase subunit beta [Alphaproteobacteria bacterium]
MADLFIELVSEDIPARMQVKACADLQRLVYAALDDLELGYAKADAADPCLVSSRHLALYVADVDDQQADRIVEKRGPRVDAPEQAINGFLASTGLTREQLVEEDTPKGRFLFARSESKGAKTADLLAPMIINILNNFPWPKSQRWGTSRFRWVRPLHRINVLFGGVVLDGALALGGDNDDARIAFGDKSYGHMFESPEDVDLAGLKDVQDYIARLKDAHVLVDHNERASVVRDQANKLADDMSCNVKTHITHIHEIANLVEWPNLLVGKIEERFMTLPAEVLQSSIQTHQKYITLEDENDKSMSPHFITVANRAADAARDDIIKAGNQRVLRARLADAEFFWTQDKAKKLEDYLPQLADITFYAGLGSVHDKARRIEKLAGDIAPFITDCDPVKAQRAGLLAKADLVTGMVGEFPELQGIMGGYYAVASGEDNNVAEAVAAHYRPQGPQDAVPSLSEAMAVSLADKIDTLVGFFGIGAKPTGSKDPYALRRAALGVIAIILESRNRIPLGKIFIKAASYHGFENVDEALQPFLLERLRVSLLDNNVAHDIAASVLQTAMTDDVLLLADTAHALAAFLATEDGAGLLAGWRRAASILAAEESKADRIFAPNIDPNLFVHDAERALTTAIDALGSQNTDLQTDVPDKALLLQQMHALGKLRTPIDHFFTNVVVNDGDPAIRENRLGLLALIRSHMQKVADFSKIEG